MPSLQELTQACSTFLGVPVVAAGIFATATDTTTKVAGIAGGTGVASLVIDDPISEGIGAVLGLRAVRRINAEAQGLTPVLLVAVTEDAVVLMDWNGNSASGTGPTRALAAFEKVNSNITMTKVGAQYRITLTNESRTCQITGTIGLLSSGKEAKKAVIAALDAHG